MPCSIIVSPPSDELESYRARFEELKLRSDPEANIKRDGTTYSDHKIQQEWLEYADNEYLKDTAW